MATSIEIIGDKTIIVTNEKLSLLKKAIIIRFYEKYAQIKELNLISHKEMSGNFLDLRSLIEDGKIIFVFNKTNSSNIVSFLNQDDICNIQNCLRKLIKYGDFY